jgi:RimJ/RimL family protein N-acetyltransferase
VRFYGDARIPEELWPADLRTPEHARATLREFVAHWERWGFGVWSVLLPDGEVIGHAGVQHTTIGGRHEVELLWFIHPDHWNHGYATEMAREAVRVAFDVLELDDLVSFTVRDNLPSRAVMGKLGMTYEREVDHAGLPHVLYRLARPVGSSGSTPWGSMPGPAHTGS